VDFLSLAWRWRLFGLELVAGCDPVFRPSKIGGVFQHGQGAEGGRLAVCTDVIMFAAASLHERQHRAAFIESADRGPFVAKELGGDRAQ
jgi:hypothetical protein